MNRRFKQTAFILNRNLLKHLNAFVTFNQFSVLDKSINLFLIKEITNPKLFWMDSEC